MKVSVVTAVYNTGKEVLETLDSVSKNDWDDMEHLILDDASTDDSVEIIRAYLERTGYRATLEQNPENKGIAYTRQVLVERSRGTYYIGISDDRMRPHRIQHSVEWMDLHPQVGVVFGMAHIFEHGTERSLGISPGWEGPVGPDGVIDSRDLAHVLLKNNFIPSMTTTIRREWLVRVGYDTSFLIEDYPLWMRLLCAGCKFGFVPEVWVDYRKIGSSVQVTRASRVALDALRSKLILWDSGLVENHVVLRECWFYYWRKWTVFETQHRREAYTALSDVTPNIVCASIRGCFDYLLHFVRKRMKGSHASQTHPIP
jgi:glycosyltransferase involved in cell wall biosynthesis